jgi:tRNA(Ile)-lysidine synthetase-like protein
VRFRRPGDRYRFGGMTRSVKKLLNEAKIPPEKRAVLPVFCDDAGIFWLPGFPVRDGCAAGEKQMTLVCFSL